MSSKFSSSNNSSNEGIVSIFTDLNLGKDTIYLKKNDKNFQNEKNLTWLLTVPGF